ncbi:leucine-rich repeat-containing protein 24-like isoform X1 [Takifugu rubripes]|uniref:Leucine rich repeat containing 24 n=2 Tax=Takifugu TaxID=31032 RepID=H2SV62_TAKRU|nr:leucine-rich repeat-containing protein 24-like isoform X1 [Takifugu rubripes]XP_029684541.1 leucine-rich repeat-containing protein 24-like isoform X1 [Takifugu rubripes]XP_029684542.1 leucine-rich repeat-containing protein 24-like isoform X1 [Takifugu rubripes]XP_056894216.1 leucine-rich repeat-containing protein 24-like [Takifugu flavidus]XP_056894217.1 leucine-rich repeat-containing protein 24-like [Takifugu flavidus]
MAALLDCLLPVLLLSLSSPSRASPSCPLNCRCYSLTVECGSTGLRGLPKNIPPSTQSVFLQDNVISQIRQLDLSVLTHLHYLYLQNNTISAVEPGSFKNQGQLLELALNGNRIHLLTADIFQGLEHLRILYLARNDITRLLDYTFRGLQRLQELHLQHNNVEVLSDQALVGLTSLALLDLSKNNLHTMGPASLQPLVSLQVLRITDNPWRCDCALHWLRGWIDEEGQRLLSSAERRLVCIEPPRLSHLSLVEIPLNSLVCIPPLVQLEHRRLAVRLGESIRVSCHASGYPRPQVTWRKASQGKTALSPRALVQELDAGDDLTGRAEDHEKGRVHLQKSEVERFDPDTGSGMLFLNNVTVAHAGFYECEAWNAGGMARVTFELAINSSTSSSSSFSSIWASWSQLSSPFSPAWPRRRGRGPVSGSDVSREPLYALGSMAFSSLGAATQTAIAVGISLLTLTALLLVAMIYNRHYQREKETTGAVKEDSILYVNDYSDGPTTFAQLEEYRDEHGHEMYVLNRAKPVLPDALSAAVSTTNLGCHAPSDTSSHTLSPTLAPSKEQQQEGDIRTMKRMAGEGGEAEPVITSEAEGMFLNHSSLFMDSQIAYEIHC